MFDIDLVTSGFLFVNPSFSEEWMSQELLPERIISISESICFQFPGTYAFEWMGYSNQERFECFEELGLFENNYKKVVNWITESYMKTVFWPGYFFNLEDAEIAKKKFFCQDCDLLLLEIGIPANIIDNFTKNGCMGENSVMNLMGRNSWLEVINRFDRCQGEVLGYELLNIESGVLSESWLCNSLEGVFAHNYGVRPNKFGLIESVSDAMMCCDLINKEIVPAESGYWLPVALLSCSKANQRRLEFLYGQ